MLKDRLVELEKKIKAAAELINRLKQENAALEMKYAEAQKKVAELTEEMERQRKEQEQFASRMEELLEDFKELPEEVAVTRSRLTAQELVVAEDKQEEVLELAGENLNNYLAHFDLGKSYEKKRLWDKAIEAYRRAIDIKPDFLDAVEHLAFLLEKLNREKEAYPLWQRVISLKK